MNRQYSTFMLLLLLTISAVGTGCDRSKPSADRGPLYETLPEWGGTLTDLSPEKTAGWVFANIDSLREEDGFQSLLEELAPRSTDALGQAIVEASQMFVVWTAYDQNSRLSVVRTRRPAQKVVESMRAEPPLSELTATRATNGLSLWVDASGWALASPAENIILAGPRQSVVAASSRLLTAEGSDKLAGVEGISTSLEISPTIRRLVVDQVDSGMFRRAFEPVETVEGQLTLDGSLSFDGRIRMNRRGNASLLATFLNVGWNRMGVEALTSVFEEAYATRIAKGMEISTSSEEPPVVSVEFTLPETDTQMWLEAFSGSSSSALTGPLSKEQLASPEQTASAKTGERTDNQQSNKQAVNTESPSHTATLEEPSSAGDHRKPPPSSAEEESSAAAEEESPTSADEESSAAADEESPAAADEESPAAAATTQKEQTDENNPPTILPP